MGLFIVGTIPAPPHVNKLLPVPFSPESKNIGSGTGKHLKLDENKEYFPGSSNNFKQLYHW
jgi:hypothetical protein